MGKLTRDVSLWVSVVLGCEISFSLFALKFSNVLPSVEYIPQFPI